MLDVADPWTINQYNVSVVTVMSLGVRRGKDGTPAPLSSPLLWGELMGLGHSSYGHLTTRCPWTMEMGGSEASLSQAVIGGETFSYRSSCARVYSGYWQDRMWSERRGWDAHWSYSLRSQLPERMFEAKFHKSMVADDQQQTCSKEKYNILFHHKV